MENQDQKKQEQQEQKEKPFSALSLALSLGYSIAIPLVALGLAGRFLDKKFNTSPWLLLAGVVLAISLSSWLVYKKTIEIIGKNNK